MSESWTNIGKSWDPTFFQKKESSKIKEKNEEKPKKHKKHKKQEKEKQKQKQIAVKFTEEEIDAFYDKLNEEKQKQLQHIDPNEGFIYKHDLGSGLLSIQIIRFGFQDIYLYGHLQKEIPQYKRIDQNLIIGLVSDQSTQELLVSIGIPILQQYTFMKQQAQPTRYMDIDLAGDGVNFKISAIKNQKSSEDYMRFSMQLNSSQDEYQMIKEQKIIQQAKEIQNKLDQNADNLESWKQLLALQESIAELQNYNEETIVAQRKLAIIEKLEKTSEVLADHPWVIYINYTFNFSNIKKNIKNLLQFSIFNY